MAITYPLATPTTIGIESINISASNASGETQSPFTYKSQVIDFGGERWGASVTIPSTRKDVSDAWVVFLLSLRGLVGTFLLGDPDHTTPVGDVSSCTLSGSAGDHTATVTMTGSLKAGDYIQLGSGSAARLHRVLMDQDGDGQLEIWPALRYNYVDETVIYDNPRGLFRLSNKVTEWSINNASAYGISFQAKEVIL